MSNELDFIDRLIVEANVDNSVATKVLLIDDDPMFAKILAKKTKVWKFLLITCCIA